VLSLAPVAGTASAQVAEQGGIVIAGGLASPRGLDVGPDGNIYVAESGSGGEEMVTVGEGEEQAQFGFGATGRITRITPDGAKSVVATNLPSWASQGEAAGPEGVIYENGALWVTVSGVPAGMPQRPNHGWLLRIDPQSGAVQGVADLQAFENANNPGGFILDSNPYGLALGTDGMIYVTDAAANALYKVSPSGGQPSVVSVFEGIPLPEALRGPGPFAGGNPEREGRFEIDPVPTGIAIAPDGHILVGLLSGFPFLEGGTKVVHVEEDGTASDSVTGLTMVVDVEYGPDGMLYVSEFGRFSLTSDPPGFAPNSGRVLRVRSDGSVEVVAQGLNALNGLAFDPGGNLFAVTNSTSTTDGEVRLIENVLAATSGPAGEPVGMPRTGQGFAPEYLLYISLMLILGGCTVLQVSRVASRKSDTR
jgi:sugar lactone lactonase YvrE